LSAQLPTRLPEKLLPVPMLRFTDLACHRLESWWLQTIL
jgi:hypothetical protein